MKTLLIWLVGWILVSAQVKTGIEVLRNDAFSALKGKKVGLVTNATAVDKHIVSTIDILFAEKSCTLTALFGPEHGARGEYAAGDHVGNYTDDITGVPVYSLYGKTRKPDADMLKNVDVIVFDIQDIGSRSYTYISTLGLVMEAAAELNKEVVVLDRPNPLGGLRIEGNLVEEGFHSFVSQFSIPYLHGLTVGELALLLNGEKLLEKGVQCKLTVIPMEGWKRSMRFKDTGLPWILTSPHIPYQDSPFYYPVTGILGELGVISEGVGYTIPFQVFAAEWIKSNELADAMNGLGLEGVIFRPITFKPFYGAHKDKTLHGVQVFITDETKVNLMALQFRFMEVHHKLHPDKDPFKLCNQTRISMFDKVCGTDKVRKMFTERMSFSDIEAFLNKDVESFRTISKKYYLYD